MYDCCTNINFKLVNRIGTEEGKNSTVYIAKDNQLDAKLIVKIVPKKQLREEFNSDDEDNYFHESKVLYKNKHPHIMEIQYASDDINNVYFSMPYCKNGSLNSLLDSRYLSVKEIIKYSLEFLSGIHYVHTNGLVHFDIKPTNILINNNHKAIITDFGLSRYTNEYGIARFTKAYTSHYPPECIGNDAMSFKADIYQAGLTLYRMCNGNENFKQQFNSWKLKGGQELATAILEGKFPEREYYLPHIPNKLKSVINKALKINPDDRYNTILDMMNDISKIEENLNWQYSNDGTKEVWSIINEKGTHNDNIYLKTDCKPYEIYGKKVKIETGTKMNIANWTKNGYNNIKDAYKDIRKLIKEY